MMKISKSALKWVENFVGKGEIARYEQFLLFPQCFQKACIPGASKGAIVWEWVNIREQHTHGISNIVQNWPNQLVNIPPISVKQP